MYHQRKSLRLNNYNYASAGAYFVTICTEHRAKLFGHIDNNMMVLNASGRMIEATWNELQTHLNLSLDALVVMPNHLHGIVVFDSHTQNLSDAMKRFKTLSTKRYIDGVKKKLWPSFEKRIWQGNFFEHIIRDERALDAIRNYIARNPAAWETDPENAD